MHTQIPVLSPEDSSLYDSRSDDGCNSDGPHDNSDTETVHSMLPGTSTDVGNSDGATTGEPLSHLNSGLMAMLVKIETDLQLTRSATLSSDLFVTFPMVVSLEEDLQQSREELLDQLLSVRQQLLSTCQALRRAMSQLSAANSHCTIIQHELGEVCVQLDNATKKKTQGSTKIQARFHTAKSMHAEFDQEDADCIEKEQVAAVKRKAKGG